MLPRPVALSRTALNLWGREARSPGGKFKPAEHAADNSLFRLGPRDYVVACITRSISPRNFGDFVALSVRSQGSEFCALDR